MKNFVRHVGTLFTGTVVAQAINLLSYPFLTRTYSTESFGSFAIFLSTAAIVGTVSCLRFDVVVQAAPFAQRRAAHRLGLLFAAPIALITALLYVLLLPFAGLESLIVGCLLGIAIYLTGYTSSSRALLIKHEQYRTTAMAGVIRTLLTAIPQVLLFWLLPDHFGLMAGYCLGAAVEAVILARAMPDGPTRPLSRRRMLAMINRYRMYPLYDLPSTLLATASFYAGNYLIFGLYGAASAGVFAIASRLATLPLALIGSNLSAVYFQRSSKAYGEGQPIWPYMRFTLKVSVALALATILAILLLVEPVVDIYLGPDWAGVAPVLIALAPLMAFRLVAVAIHSTALVYRQPNWSLVNSAALLTVLLGAAVAAWVWKLDFLTFLWLTTVASSMVYACFILFLLRTVTCGRYEEKIAFNSPRLG